MNLFSDITYIDILDIVMVACLLYGIFLWFKKTKSVFIFVGIVISGLIYQVVNILGLRLLSTIMQGFFAVFLIAIVVIFQEEIRRLFERIALFSLSPKLNKLKRTEDYQPIIEVLTDSFFFFSEKHIGAIVVLKGNDTLYRNIRRGIALDGRLSAPLLKSIFDAHSDGHDGAVIIEGNKVLKFACHLPLSKDVDQLKNKGTRHVAALGLSEVSDALCLVVSETSGDILIFQNGKFENVKNREDFKKLLVDFYDSFGNMRVSPQAKFSISNLKQKTIVFALAVFLWWFFVHESVVVYKSFDVPINYINLDRNITVTEIVPDQVRVVLSAPRRRFYFVEQRDIKVLLKVIDVEDLNKISPDDYEIIVTASDVNLPGYYSIVNVFPRSVRLRIEAVK